MSTEHSERRNGISDWCSPRLALPWTSGERPVYNAEVTPYMETAIRAILSEPVDPPVPVLRRFRVSTVDPGRMAVMRLNPIRTGPYAEASRSALAALELGLAVPTIPGFDLCNFAAPRPGMDFPMEFQAARERLEFVNRFRGINLHGFVESMISDLVGGLAPLPSDCRREMSAAVQYEGPVRRPSRRRATVGNFGCLMDTEPGEDRLGRKMPKLAFEQAERNRGLQYED